MTVELRLQPWTCCDEVCTNCDREQHSIYPEGLDEDFFYSQCHGCGEIKTEIIESYSTETWEACHRDDCRKHKDEIRHRISSANTGK